MSGSNPIGTVIDALRDYLLQTLASSVTAVNAQRAPVLKSSVGSFTVPAAARLMLGTSREPSSWTQVALTDGSRTATQIASEINTAAPSGITASADSLGRLVLTGQAPTTTTPALVVVGEDVSSGSYTAGGNAALGWEPGGEHVYRTPLRAPTWRGVTDGLPNSVPDMGQGFWVIIDDREATPIGSRSLRHDSWAVRLLLRICKPEASGNPHRNREGITAAIWAVSDVLLGATGRSLGTVTGVGPVEILSEAVSGSPIRFSDAPNVLFDAATLTVSIKINQLPT